MIQIIPAISIFKSKVARMSKGDVNQIKYYPEPPIDMALRFEESGIKRVHVIDLEGALAGNIMNAATLETISGYTNLEIDFGGGVTDDGNLRFAFQNGANAVHAGSIAASDRELFSSWIISYGRNKIILAADVANESIVTKGWSKNTKIDLMEMVDYYYNHGIVYLKCTDVMMDDAMAGPSIILYKKILSQFPAIKLIASGGIRSVEDIERLEQAGVYGVIFAKALYEDKIRLKDLEKFAV